MKKTAWRGRYENEKRVRVYRRFLWGCMAFVLGALAAGLMSIQAGQPVAGAKAEQERQIVSGRAVSAAEDRQSVPEQAQDFGTEPAVEVFGSGAVIGSWNLRLVNAAHPLTGISEPDLTETEDGYLVDTRIAGPLEQMLSDCRKAGGAVRICSAYRSLDRQQSLYERKIAQFTAKGYGEGQAEEEAARIVAPPGTSEHNLGLAVDLVAEDYQLLDEGQEKTREARWLMRHCADYGFILRYPSDKSEITGIIYEPWHYRYVGVEAAEEIMERGICLEEYLAQL